MAYDNASPAQGHQALSDIDIIRNNTNELRKHEASLSTAPPSNPVGGMFWWTTDPPSLYQRNQANTTWLLIWNEEGVGYGPAWYHTPGFDGSERNVKNHFDKNITAAVAVHGIKQGSGNGFDADKLDGNEASAFLAGSHAAATSGVHGSGSSILLHLPTSVPMLIIASTAPTSWTQVTSYNDRVIRIVSGAGGGQGGSWTISGLSTTAEAGHTHGISPDGGSIVVYSYDAGQGPTSVQPPGSHSHGGATGAGSSHAHTVPSDASWRPLYLDCIAVTKNA